MITHEISAEADLIMGLAAEVIRQDCALVLDGWSIQQRFEGWRKGWASRGLAPKDAATVAMITLMLGALSRQEQREFVKKN